MLDIAEKLFGQIIHARLEAAIQQAVDLLENQYGFRKGHSTIDAIGSMEIASDAISGSRYSKRMCVVIALNVRNAFNSEKWHNIMLTLENLEVPLYLQRIMSSYLIK